MKPLVVYCGNGGDFEFERDRIYWRQWITENMPSAYFFVIKPHEDADKAYIIFEAERWNDVFLLQAPEFITHEHLRSEY